MTDEERYLFDLMGYLVVENALTATEVAELNALIDQRDPWGAHAREGIGTMSLGQGNLHVGPLEAWEAPFRRLVANPRLVPYLTEMIGPKCRYDHGYAIFMHRAGAKHRLHGGGTPYDPGQYYHWRNERMYNGLIVVSYALGDVNPGDGGFAAVPGSHKSNLPCPEDIKQLERLGPWVIQVPQPTGSAIIFTEALTHGTWPWQADRERRSLLFKYSPGHMSWSSEYPAAAAVPETADDAVLRKLMEPPYIGSRARIVE